MKRLWEASCLAGETTVCTEQHWREKQWLPSVSETTQNAHRVRAALRMSRLKRMRDAATAFERSADAGASAAVAGVRRPRIIHEHRNCGVGT